MLQRVERALGLRTNPVVFFTSAAFIVLFVAAAAIFPGVVSGVFGAMAAWISASLGWLYILLVTLFVGFVLVVGFSRYGKLRLGPDGSRPEYTNWAWFAMLFTAGIGSVLMFYGVAEPVSNFSANPMNLETETERAAAALNFPLYHYGLHAWGVFSLAGLALAYFAYRKGMPMRMRSAFYPIFGEKVNGPVGHVIDIFTVLGTAFGVAVTLGLAGSQVNAGLTRVAGVGDSNLIQAAIVVVITAFAAISVGVGLDKGIRRLGQLNMILAITLMAFIVLVGPTVFIFQGTVQAAGYYFQNIIEFSFWNQAYNDDGWQSSWTVFIWAWQISWAPFVGMFVARISYGRTIREFVLGVLLAPLAFTIVWFGVFGSTALNIELNGAGGLAAIVDETLQVALFAMLEQFPLAIASSILSLVVIVIFFATSADSTSLVLDTLTSGDEGDSLARQRVFWAASLGLIALVLLFADGLDALSNVVTVTGLPFLIILALMGYSLMKSLRDEDTSPTTQPAQTATPTTGNKEPSADREDDKARREEVSRSR